MAARLLQCAQKCRWYWVIRSNDGCRETNPAVKLKVTQKSQRSPLPSLHRVCRLHTPATFFNGQMLFWSKCRTTRVSEASVCYKRTIQELAPSRSKHKACQRLACRRCPKGQAALQNTCSTNTSTCCAFCCAQVSFPGLHTSSHPACSNLQRSSHVDLRSTHRVP